MRYIFGLCWVGLATLAVTLPARAANILVVRKSAQPFAEVKEGLAEVAEKNQLIDYVITQDSTYEEFEAKVRDVKPSLLVLMDNKPVNFGIKLSKEGNSGERKIRIVATMGINLKKSLKSFPAMAGVAYEVPGFTLMTSFRSIVTSPVKTVLTFYRASEFQNIIDDTKTQLAREGIELIPINVEDKAGDPKALAEFLAANMKEVVNNRKIDAIYVLNDNILLNEATFASVWLERARSIKVPFLCGIDKFVSKQMDFCTYAASPHHIALGQQVSQMILSILEDNQENLGVEYIVSVIKKVNLDRIMKLGLGIKAESLEGVRIAD